MLANPVFAPVDDPRRLLTPGQLVLVLLETHRPAEEDPGKSEDLGASMEEN